MRMYLVFTSALELYVGETSTGHDVEYNIILMSAISVVINTYVGWQHA